MEYQLVFCERHYSGTPGRGSNSSTHFAIRKGEVLLSSWRYRGFLKWGVFKHYYMLSAIKITRRHLIIALENANLCVDSLRLSICIKILFSHAMVAVVFNVGSSTDLCIHARCSWFGSIPQPPLFTPIVPHYFLSCLITFFSWLFLVKLFSFFKYLL